MTGVSGEPGLFYFGAAAGGVWKTINSGASWTPIFDKEADLSIGAVAVAASNHKILYVGSGEKGVFVSFDDGGAWRPLQLDLPSSPVHDLAVAGDNLVAATHGRSFWILDDVTPLRQISDRTAAAPVVLYTPQTALRLYYPDAVDTRRPVGENPPAGAIIDYAFRTAPSSEVIVEILDAQGAVIRHLSSTRSDKVAQPPEWPDQKVPNDKIPAAAGMNRLVWDLRMSDPAQIPGAFYAGPTPRGPLVPPGRYQVRLTANGQTPTAPLTLIADPRVKDSEPAIAAKATLAIAVWRDIDRLHMAVNAIRAARAALPPGTTGAAARMTAIEEVLMQVNMKGSEANLAYPGMLNVRLATFALNLDDADQPATEQTLALYKSLHAQLEVQLAAWDRMKAETKR